MNVTVGNKHIRHDFLVRKTDTYPGASLIGSDFLRRCAATIDHNNNTVTLMGQKVPFQSKETENTPSVSVVRPNNDALINIDRVGERCNLPQGSQVIRYLTVHPCFENTDVIVDPLPRYRPVLGRTQATVKHGRVRIS